MRLTKVILPTLLLASLAAPAWGAPPPGGPPPSGWTFNGSQLVWTAPRPVPMGDAAIEFWDGDRVLGRPRPSPDLRTFTLDAPKITGRGELAVRAGGRRLDVQEQLPAAKSAPSPVPAPQPVNAIDPGQPGPFQTRTGEYTLDPIRLPGYSAPVEMQAVVVAPKNLPGKRPLALFLHGRHFTCYVPGDPNSITGDWPCAANAKPVPSHRGYLQAQQLLASQGYVTVSISANGINGQDFQSQDGGAQARSSLVRQHLAKWADWASAGRGSAPDIVKAAPAADLSNVLLVGHSRGGEGVNRAAMDSITPPPGDTGFTGPVRWTIRGDLLIGPTIFGQNPAPDVPSATILPGCDGDVSDLEGEMYLDATRGVSRGAAVHSALYVIGANHNFFNTEWTPGQSEAPSNDDFFGDGDAVCAPGTPTRLTATQQQNAGATYIAAAARLFVFGDQRVLPLLDGSGVRAPSADPARVLSHAVGAARSPFVVPDDATTASGSARVCAQVTRDAAASCVDPVERRPSPHFTPFIFGLGAEPGRFAVAMQWSAAGHPAVVRPGKPVSLAGSRDLAMRLVVPPNSKANRFDVAITDTRGRRVQLGSVSLDGLPATERMSARWAQEVRVPLPFHGIDLRQVAALELIPRTGTGQAWLIDAYGWNNGMPDPRPVALPRVDVGALTVQEGDSGTKKYQIPITVTGDGPGSVRLFIGDEQNFTTQLVTLQPGQHTIEIPPIEVVGNTRWSSGSTREVLAKAVQGTVAGNYIGGLTVLNDDPEPTLTLTPIADRVTEGSVLTWRLTLSTEADSPFFRLIRPRPPTGGPELSSTDVDPEWFRQNTYGPEDPLPSRPLSTTSLLAFVVVPPGQLSADVTVPTVTDTEAEPDELVLLNLLAWPPGGREFDVVGTVTDKP